jgi:hypothetical protein
MHKMWTTGVLHDIAKQANVCVGIDFNQELEAREKEVSCR